MERIGRIKRRTKETDIEIELNLDGQGRADINTGLGFLDHMLTLLTSHGLFDLTVKATGDLEVDGHHTVEDIGISLGAALSKAVGDKAGIKRYGQALIPMDECLGRAVLDLSGRPWLSYRVEPGAERVGEFETGLAREFFLGLAGEARMTLHLDSWHGQSAHHVLEAIFKAFGRALAEATASDPRRTGIPSTKGVL